jgi:N-acetylornithine carbamoyltransferase
VNARDFYSLEELSDPEIGHLLDAAETFRCGRISTVLSGRSVGLVFLAPSLRTRSSMESATARLGGHPVVIAPGSGAWRTEMRDGVVMDGDAAEHVREAAAVLARHHAILAVRSFPGLQDAAEDRRDAVLAAYRAHSGVPIVNMESARWHPLQALADRMTLRRELGPNLAARRIVLTWAPHPKPLPTSVPASFVLAAARTGAEVTVARPEGFALPDDVMAAARAHAERTGGTVHETDDRDQAFDGAHAIYAKSWGSPAHVGRWDVEAELRAAHTDWTVDEQAMNRTDDGIFMHCLPVRRGVVVTDGVLDGPHSRVIDQAENRLWTAMAVLESLALRGSTP